MKRINTPCRQLKVELANDLRKGRDDGMNETIGGGGIDEPKNKLWARRVVCGMLSNLIPFGNFPSISGFNRPTLGTTL